MKLKIAALIVAWIAFAQTLVYAQTDFKLSGKVADATGKGLDGATVYLLRANDSAVVKTAIADAGGNYLFNQLKAANYKLSVTMMGYHSYKSAGFELKKDTVIGAINLETSGTALKEVQVSAQRPFVQQKIDRTVVNPEALISNTGGTALDVLEKAPGVIVDQNGAISLKGRGVTIFIDDKPTYLSGADLENYLRSLASATIDQIELMPNPPAKYDAAGNGGVINIRTKKSKVKGFNGAVNLSYAQGHYARTNNSVNFNYRNNKLNIFSSLSGFANSSFNDLDINRHFENASGAVYSNFLQNSYLRRTGQSVNLKLGVDYYASEKTTLGIGLTGLYNPIRQRSPVTSQFLNANYQLDSVITAQNDDKRNFRNGGINLNYRHQFDKNGKELSADLDYLNYQTGSNQSFDNTSRLANGTVKSHDLLTGDLPAHIDIYSAKMDYTHPLKSGFKLSAGGKSSYTNTDNVADYFYTINGITTTDYGKTNHFLYRENINAGYLNANKDWKRLSLQAGLRLENTWSNGHQLGNAQKSDSTFNRNYTSLFPTFFLQYKLDTADKHQLSFNYGRRIDRPYYQDLNPFLSPLDKFTYYAGNPFLKPSFNHEVEINYTYSNRITFALNYNNTRDEVDETIEIKNGTYYSRPGNIGTTIWKSASIDATFDPAKWFNFHFYGQVANIHSTSAFYTGPLDTRGTFFFVRPILQFKLPHDWTAQLDASYQSKVTSAQFIAGRRGRVNGGLSKKLSASTSVKLVVNDMFYNWVNSGIINNLANTKADYRNLNDSRNVVLSLSYRFGKAIADQRKHNANGAESEQNRVKN